MCYQTDGKLRGASLSHINLLEEINELFEIGELDHSLEFMRHLNTKYDHAMQCCGHLPVAVYFNTMARNLHDYTGKEQPYLISCFTLKIFREL